MFLARYNLLVKQASTALNKEETIRIKNARSLKMCFTISKKVLINLSNKQPRIKCLITIITPLRLNS